MASEAALAAGAQGKFLEMDKLIFAQQRAITQMLRDKAAELGMPGQERSEQVQREVFIDLAGQLGLNVDGVRYELENRVHLEQIQAETAQASRVGATGTPASFINGRYLRGAQPYEKFEQEVQKEINWAQGGNRPSFAKGTSVAQLRPAQQQRRGPDPNKVYDLKAGNSPSQGPSGAKVTILHYLDYQ